MEYFHSNDVKTPLLSPEDGIPLDFGQLMNEDLNLYRDLFDDYEEEDQKKGIDFIIEYIHFTEVIEKVQRRKIKMPGSEEKNYSQQRLNKDQSLVRLRLLFPNNGQPTTYEVFIQRVPDAAQKMKEKPMLVPVQPFDTNQNGPAYEFSVDLDSVYMHEGKQVYRLAKNQTDEVNRFQLLIKVHLIDGTVCYGTTKSFLIKGRPQKNTGDILETSLTGVYDRGHKRPRTDTHDSCGSGSISDSISGYSYSPDGSFKSSPEEKLSHTNYNAFTSIVTNQIQAHMAMIDDLTVVEPIKTTRGDIAYHFVLKDPYSHPDFKKGECVGFFMDKLGKTVIDKLTPFNYNDAFLKGVITRDQYIEAKMPVTDDVRTETICMVGVVPVLVEGTVNHGEVLYASSYNPGTAVSEYSTIDPHENSGNGGAIGYAMETVKCEDEKQVNLVNCYVSIMVGFEGKLIERKVAEVHVSVDSAITLLKWQGWKEKRCRRIGYVTVFILAVLFSIFCWQYFAPGTAFRYWQCHWGSIKGTASYRFIPIRNQFVHPTVRGIKFNFDVLEKKMHFNYAPMKGKDVNYYLNLDRCAYGGLRETKDKNLGLKAVYGPNVFAINVTCKEVWYYHDRKLIWERYRSAVGIKCNA